METSILVSLSIFLLTFGVIFSGKLNRTIVSLFGAVMMVVFGIFLGFYTPDNVLLSIDFDTIILLGSMMIIVAIFESSGAFQYLAIKTAKKTKGKPWLLLVALGTLTTLLSLILDNVTTIVLIVPVTIIIASIIKINPAPILLAEVFLSNIGGVATLVGDPPNIMIGSAAGFSFTDFLTHSLPVVFFAWFFSLLFLRFIFRKELKDKPKNINHLLKMKESKSIKDPKVLRKTLFVLSIIIVLFFLHHSFHIKPSLVALFGASLLLLIVSPYKDPEEIFEKMELSVLVFFSSLFVIVGGLEQSGVLNLVSNLVTFYAQDNIILTAIIILWGTALISSIVGNIPMTVAMIPIISYLQTQGIESSGLLWWALVFGVGFGANITPIGSAAGVLVMSKSENTDYPLSFKDWLKSGLIVSIICLFMSTFAIIFFASYLAL